jgi:hypothetical protein
MPGRIERAIEKTGPIVSQSTIDEARALEEHQRHEWAKEQRRQHQRTHDAAVTTAQFHVDNELPVPWQAVKVLLEDRDHQ